MREQRGGGEEAETSGSGVRRDRARPELTTKEEDGSVVSRGPLRSAHLTFSPSLFPLFLGLDSSDVLRTRFFALFHPFRTPISILGARLIAVRGGVQLSEEDFGVGFCFLSSKLGVFFL